MHRRPDGTASPPLQTFSPRSSYFIVRQSSRQRKTLVLGRGIRRDSTHYRGEGEREHKVAGNTMPQEAHTTELVPRSLFPFCSAGTLAHGMVPLM